MKFYFSFSLIFALVFAFGQPAQWNPAGLGGGGGMFSPSISPFDNDNLFIISDMGGIFNSNDGGDNWSVIDFNQIRANIESRVNFTSASNILYSIGNYDWPNYRMPVKSTDGGTTWNALTGDPTNAETYFLFADPNSTERVLLSSYHSLYFSNDGGASFTQVYTSNDLYIGGVFWSGDDIFVGCIDGLLTSHDNGSSFALENFSDDMPADFGILTMTGAKEGSAVRLFCVARSASSLWPGLHTSQYWSEGADVFRLNYPTSDGWERKNSGINAGDFPFFVSMANDNINTVYVAGATEWPEYQMIYKSTNGGDSWVNTFHVANNQNIATGWMGDGGDLNWGWAGSSLGFGVCQNNPDIAITTDWGFAHITTDGGDTWQQIYVPAAESNPANNPTPTGQNYHSNGLEITSSWWLTWITANDIFASYTDFTGMISHDGGQSWSFNYSGNDYNSTYQVIKRADGKLFAAVSSKHDLYQSTYLTDDRIDGGTGEILQSDDNGITWSSLHDFGHPVIWITLSPNDSDKMYASVVHSTQGGIFYSSDAGSTWTKLTNPPRTEGHPFNIRILDDGNLVCSYSGRRDDTGFTLSSGVFYSTDNGVTWEDRSHSDMYRWTKDIIIDPHDANQNTWYACVFSHWGSWPNEVGGIFRTTDRGINWERINSLYRVNSLTVHPDFPDIAYITTETQGLWYSSDFSAGTPTFTPLSFPFSHPMRIFFNPFNHDDIWATSFGNGMRNGNTNIVAVEYLQPLRIKVLNDKIELFWSTATESNSRYFEIERSTNSTDWKKICEIKANGNSETTNNYKAIDSNPLQGYSYYRLKQIDNNGTGNYSNIVSVYFKELEISVFPNPSNGIINIKWHTQNLSSKISSIEILNTDGKQILSIQNPKTLTNTLQLDGIKSGTYILHISDEQGKSFFERFVVISN